MAVRDTTIPLLVINRLLYVSVTVLCHCNLGSSKTNASLWSTVIHIREEEAIAKGRWLENIRATQGENVANKRKTALRVKVINTHYVNIIYLDFLSGRLSGTSVRRLASSMGETGSTISARLPGLRSRSGSYNRNNIVIENCLGLAVFFYTVLCQ